MCGFPNFDAEYAEFGEIAERGFVGGFLFIAFCWG